ncbi:hypothetical protein Scep_000862 [Stephania cephalantha]|uniref:Uncharacterized protein n=1 Tax=Stephania cephalantha TaxID=152367 RepID=A0AAP0Q751_9MAGN
MVRASDLTSSDGLVYGRKYSSVVPAKVTGEKVVRNLSNLDLAMKLHYLRGVYFFNRSAVEGLDIYKLKEPMFKWLEIFNVTSGRIRRDEESGRPFIRCNDGGVRIVEAQCDKTLDECIELMSRDGHSFDLYGSLVPNQVLGPDLHFSPLVFVQFTWFKCGGISVGLSWSHILGDAYSSSKFINAWAQVLAGNHPTKPILNPTAPNSPTKTAPAEPLSLKQVPSVGDHWVAPNPPNLRHLTLQITPTHLAHMTHALSSASNQEISPFEAISAIIWQCLGKIRAGSTCDPKFVTVIKNKSLERANATLGNTQSVSVVKGESYSEAGELAEVLVNEAVEETVMVGETVGRDKGVSDFVVYGANLTFVEAEEAEVYGLELNGHRPVFASYAVDGAGDKGVVVVLPGRESGGRVVSVLLPESEVSALKMELKKRWGIA